MMIDRIGQLDPVLPGKKPGRNNSVEGSDRGDSITVSQEAKEKAEVYQVMELIKTAPDLDESRIAELRRKINDPGYLNERVLSATAEKLLNTWFS